MGTDKNIKLHIVTDIKVKISSCKLHITKPLDYIEVEIIIMASQESTSSDTSNQPVKTIPKDALVMAAILKEMGVNEYEPRIINQMVEFAYRYVTDIVSDARVYMTHANRKTISIDDIKLSVSQKLDHSFTSPPPREFLLDIARTKNSQPLPLIQDRCGLRLPPERYCLTGNNYKVKSTTKKAASQRKAGAPNKPSSTSTSTTATNKTSTVSSVAAPPTSLNVLPAQNMNLVSSMETESSGNTNVTSSHMSLPVMPPLMKRKREDDDDYDT